MSTNIKNKTVVFIDGITVDYNFVTGEATVWNADHDYDAIYNIADAEGIANEIATIRAFYASVGA